ncbi:MAG: RNA polymerase sigma factor [Candidatus Limnocylindrales bacterium]
MTTERPGSRMNAQRDHELALRAATDAAAFGELYDFYLPRIYGFVARRVDGRDVAQAIVTTTFERGLEVVRSGTFRTQTFGGWLYRVAATAIVDHAARSGRSLPAGVRTSDHGEPGDGRAEALVGDEAATSLFVAALDRDELRRAFGRISEPQRRVLVLKYLDGLTSAELCATLGVSGPTLDLRLQRALRALLAGTRTKGNHAA